MPIDSMIQTAELNAQLDEIVIKSKITKGLAESNIKKYILR